MSAAFETDQPSYRVVATNYGDDLQAVCARELGDANRWPELVWLNNLVPPYLTSNIALVTDGVLLTGSAIKVPSTSRVPVDADSLHAIFGRDVAVTNGRLELDASGDLAVVSGSANLSQQLKHRIITPRGQARRHATYGCRAYELIGKASGPVAAKLAGEYVLLALQADYRVKAVKTAVATVAGDKINSTAQCVAINGSAIDVVT